MRFYAFSWKFFHAKNTAANFYIENCLKLFFKFNANDEHEREHMLEHLKNMIGDKDTAQMTPEELQFYYFKQHDYDNNNKLDGIELIQGKLNIKFQKKL